MNDYSFEPPIIPHLPPVDNYTHFLEMESDYSYLKYLYPKIPRQMIEFVEEQCDQMEQEGSLMFDLYPDKTALQIMAAGIQRDFIKKYPDVSTGETGLLRDLIEVLLFHEIMHRRNRYRNHKRLYF